MTSSDIVRYGHGYLAGAIAGFDLFARSPILDHRALLSFENDAQYFASHFNATPVNAANYQGFTPSELVLAHAFVNRLRTVGKQLVENWAHPALRLNAQEAVLALWHKSFTGSFLDTDLVLFTCSPLWIDDGVQAFVRCNELSSGEHPYYPSAVAAPRWFHQLIDFMTLEANSSENMPVGPALPMPSSAVLADALLLWEYSDYNTRRSMPDEFSAYASLSAAVFAAEKL